jgi:chemotaxis protein MotB
MRGERLCGVLCVVIPWAANTGCVSLDRHRRLEAANRRLAADKEGVERDLFDERSNNDNLRRHVEMLERERGSQEALVSNLQRENARLDETRTRAVNALESLAGKTQLGDINILSPKLPAPLDTALKRFADDHPSNVIYDPAAGSIKWNADLLFDLGSDEVKSSSLAALQGFSEVLNSPAAADFEVVVVGHTDNKPIKRQETRLRHPTNWHLSTNRAIAVSTVLQQNGYSPKRITVAGCSEYRPVADNASEQGAGLNRRVDIYFVPSGSILQSSARAASRGAGSNPAPRTPRGNNVDEP